MPKATDIDEAALRAVYEEGRVSLRAIAAAFRIDRRRILRLAGQGGWVRPDKPMSLRARARGLASPADWRELHKDLDLAALRRAYEEAEVPIRVLCGQFSVSAETIQQLASENGWVRSKRAWRAGALTAPRALRAEALIGQLYEMLGTQIKEMAARGQEAEGRPEPSPLRLEQLARCLKTINDLRAAVGGPEAAEREDPRDRRSADEIRAEIRRKLMGEDGAQD